MRLPLIYEPITGSLSGATWEEVRPFYPFEDPIRRIEKASIRLFMESQQQYLGGRTLDFGCYQMPYRDLVTGEYVGVNEGDRIPDGTYDAIICNQVMQYLVLPYYELGRLFGLLRPGTPLIMSIATNWDVVEDVDLFRYTQYGINKLLTCAGFVDISTQLRAAVRIGNFNFPLGYGVVARRPE